jgi:L-serine dehydratase
MDKLPSSIFNDVIGPVMRGSSSSHVAAASRIGALVRQSLSNNPARVMVEFDVNGSLAETHEGHGTDIGFVSGIMGIEMTDPAAMDALRLAKEAGVEIEFHVIDFAAKHPNHFRISATGRDGDFHSWEAISTGGGMIEMLKYDGFDVHIEGGFYEFLVTLAAEDIFADSVHSAGGLLGSIKTICPYVDFIDVKHAPKKALASLKFASKPEPSAPLALRKLQGVQGVVSLEPILPTLSRTPCTVPFRTPAQLEALAKAASPTFDFELE